MRAGGQTADTEKWESDTDSDYSEEEQDFSEGAQLREKEILALCQ